MYNLAIRPFLLPVGLHRASAAFAFLLHCGNGVRRHPNLLTGVNGRTVQNGCQSHFHWDFGSALCYTVRK
jgi:hypothetical protein